MRNLFGCMSQYGANPAKAFDRFPRRPNFPGSMPQVPPQVVLRCYRSPAHPGANGTSGWPNLTSAAWGCRLGRLAVLTISLVFAGGCGISRWSDTPRTATEQLLLSDAIDRAVSKMNLSALAGKTVFLDDTPIRGMTDAAYLSSCVRQHLLASGAILKESRDQAAYVLELRAGAIGTDRHDVTYGLPAVTIPNMAPGVSPGAPQQLPEIPLAKKTHQRGVAKIAAFAYNRETGRPVWQSGVIPVETDVRALWIFGAGPFVNSRAGSRVLLAGDPLPLPPVHLALENLLPHSEQKQRPPSVTQEAFFSDRSSSTPPPETSPASQPALAPPNSAPPPAELQASASDTTSDELPPAGAPDGQEEGSGHDQPEVAASSPPEDSVLEVSGTAGAELPAANNESFLPLVPPGADGGDGGMLPALGGHGEGRSSVNIPGGWPAMDHPLGLSSRPNRSRRDIAEGLERMMAEGLAEGFPPNMPGQLPPLGPMPAAVWMLQAPPSQGCQHMPGSGPGGAPGQVPSLPQLLPIPHEAVPLAPLP